MIRSRLPELDSAQRTDSPAPTKFPFFGRLLDERAFAMLAREFGTPPEASVREMIENVLSRGEYEKQLLEGWPSKRAQAGTAVEDAVHDLAIDPGGRLWLGCAAVAEARFAGQLDRALALHFEVWETYHLALADLDRRALPRSVSKLGLARSADEIRGFGWLLPSLDEAAGRVIGDVVRAAIADALADRAREALGRELQPLVASAIEPVKHRWLALIGDCSPWVDPAIPRRARRASE